jgi:hypothetical protein
MLAMYVLNESGKNFLWHHLVGGMPKVQEIHGAVYQRMLLNLSMNVHRIGMLPNHMMTPVKGQFTASRMSMVCGAYRFLLGTVVCRCKYQ